MFKFTSSLLLAALMAAFVSPSPALADDCGSVVAQVYANCTYYPTYDSSYPEWRNGTCQPGDGMQATAQLIPSCWNERESVFVTVVDVRTDQTVAYLKIPLQVRFRQLKTKWVTVQLPPFSTYSDTAGARELEVRFSPISNNGPGWLSEGTTSIWADPIVYPPGPKG